MARQQKTRFVNNPAVKAPKRTGLAHDLNPQGGISPWKKLAAFAILLIAIGFGYKGYLETRVNTPYDDKKIVVKTGLDVPERYWGSYRPGLYFGMKTRDPHSLVFGMMWYFPRQLGPGGAGIRHWCEQGDNLDRYTWVQHDGSNFGVQEIEDGPFSLTTSFVKRLGGNHGGDWTARISVGSKNAQLNGEAVSLVLYVALEEKTLGSIKPAQGAIPGIVGSTEGLGAFTIKMLNHTGQVEQTSHLVTVAPGLHLLKEVVVSSLRLTTDRRTKQKHIVLPGDVRGPGQPGPDPNFIAVQVTARVPSELDVVYESASSVERQEALSGAKYSEELGRHRDAFHHRFENTFHLEKKGFSQEEIKFAEATLSNLIGGIGYFYGASRVESSYTKGPVPYWKAPLYTAVPSRSFFPRGFLWDEGFHGLLISTWDLDISLDIMSHWFDLMNAEGWIPREQILGQEALAKVPEEFVTQRNSYANPPTFFLTLQFILRNFADTLLDEPGRLATLERLYPRLERWFSWFNTTQTGDLAGTYRWQGRDATTDRELNPKTLTSGLDDYPRASHPNVDERHVDLRCWISLAASSLSEIAHLLNRNGEKYGNTFRYLSDVELLDKLHWSSRTESYSDYGLHTDAVVLKRPPPPPKIPGHHHPPPNREKVRVVLEDPELRFVDTTFGYVSLFPFLLLLVEPSSPKLGKVLEDLRNPDLLWTDYGLRSLARTSPLYMKYNTEHDPPYWRGPIWINLNYLTARALLSYARMDGPFKAKARSLYDQLRSNIIRNIYKQYRRSGYVWEQYSDTTGEGKGSRPFTGWSSLVVLLMAEIY
ncbi:mannosyl-oligosaccharide glucosidase isoform X2 [Bacillus rossius redtenbacheri]